jgi:hypothetical protein
MGIDVTGEALAAALAEALNTEVPDEILVTAESDSIGPRHESEYYGGTALDPILKQSGDLEENVELAALAALQSVQDGIVRILQTPWPTTTQLGTQERRSEVPDPGAAVRNGKLHIWYGDSADPVLGFDPIDLLGLK